METREIDWKVQRTVLLHVTLSNLFPCVMCRVSCCCTAFQWKTNIELGFMPFVVIYLLPLAGGEMSTIQSLLAELPTQFLTFMRIRDIRPS